MATLLYRLGRWAYGRPWRVLIAWVVLGAAIGTGAVLLGGQTQESYAIPGTESQEAIDKLDAVFPQAAGANIQVVYQAPEGDRVEDDRYSSAIDEMAADLERVDGVESVSTPFSEFATDAVSDDGRVGITQVTLDSSSEDVSEATIEEVLATADSARDAGLTVEFGGQVFQDNEFGITIIEAFGVVFAAVVLVMTFGSLLAAGFPLLVALVAVGITVGAITLVASFASVSSTAPMLALMIGLAVGIDYSLFIVSRHRNQLATGMDPRESAGSSIATAGSAVVFAGLTVIIALLGLLVVGIPFLSVMGVAAAGAVLVAVLVSVTLLPALLGLAGRRLAPKPGSRAARRAIAAMSDNGAAAPGPAGASAAASGPEASDIDALATSDIDTLGASDTDAIPAATSPSTDAAAPTRDTPDTASSPGVAAVPVRALDAEDAKPSFGTRWVRLLLKAPIVPVVLVVGLLGALLVPALQLQLSLPDNGSEPRDSTQRKAYDIVADAFGPGRNGPLLVLVDITQTTEVLEDLEEIRERLGELPDVSAVGPGTPNPSVDTAIIQVIPESSPDSPETTALVERIRDLAPSIEEEFGTPLAVTGTTAVMIDISSTLGRALIPFAAIVLGLSILLLMMVFRSLFVPIKAALGFLLSIIGSFGVVVAVFQLGWFADVLGVEPGPILSFLPILLIAVLFGLAMDYEVFLVSGMRETWVHTRDARRAVEVGFAHAARVVTAAALIMFFVFASFVPEGSGPIKPIALALATGILFDAFLVRMTLVPAAMALAGRAAWYLPRWLGRLLPNVDIEGESLGAHRTGLEWARARDGAAVSAEGLIIPGADAPLSIEVPSGGIGVIAADPWERRAVLSALSGRLPIIAGHAQVLGLPLPSDATGIARRVALLDIAPVVEPPVGELINERLTMTRPPFGSRRASARVIFERMASALDLEGLPPVRRGDRTAALPLEGRIAVALALGVASGAGVVAIDLGETEGRRLETALRLADAIVLPETSVLFAAAAEPQPETRQSRPLATASLRRKAVLS
ncbi:MMPL family transporter [Naasia sp. SYSU D00948]|uniref:MMPL family transporter n=1 Tax=Naasia sp. SYSU D00948 TaxID=2817379 RepID=UPI001B305748|nr:MMPL family transporter [Naasia sp. SYSU D00948]